MTEHYREIKRRRAAGDEDASGFTLIELLIVIVVLGILAATVIFALGGVTGSSASASCNSDAKSVQVAAQAYISENGLQTNMTSTNLTSAADGINGNPYLHSWPENTQYYTVSIGGDGTVSVKANAGPNSGQTWKYDSGAGAICASL